MIMTDEPITQTAAATPLVGLLDRIALEDRRDPAPAAAHDSRRGRSRSGSCTRV